MSIVHKYKLEVWGAANYNEERTAKSRVIVYKDLHLQAYGTMSIVCKHKLEVWGAAESDDTGYILDTRLAQPHRLHMKLPDSHKLWI